MQSMTIVEKKRSINARYVLELADGQLIEVDASPSGDPVILCSDLPSSMKVFSESHPPTHRRNKR